MCAEVQTHGKAGGGCCAVETYVLHEHSHVNGSEIEDVQRRGHERAGGLAVGRECHVDEDGKGREKGREGEFAAVAAAVAALLL